MLGYSPLWMNDWRDIRICGNGAFSLDLHAVKNITEFRQDPILVFRKGESDNLRG